MMQYIHSDDDTARALCDWINYQSATAAKLLDRNEYELYTDLCDLIGKFHARLLKRRAKLQDNGPGRQSFPANQEGK